MTCPRVRRVLVSGVLGMLLAGELLAAGVLQGCATQRGTSQALTIAGAAAVVVGASMAAGGQCYDSGSPGSPLVSCSQGLSKGARRAGTVTAVVGAGVAAAGYALEPKGPDTLLQPAQPPSSAPGQPYRLVRPSPEPTPEASPVPGSASATSANGVEPEPAEERCPAPVKTDGAPSDGAQEPTCAAEDPPPVERAPVPPGAGEGEP